MTSPQEDKVLKFTLRETISGNGTSLWSASKGKYPVTRGTLRGCLFDEYPRGIWELCLYGPTLQWFQYTDQQIVAEVRSKLTPLLEEKIGHKISHIGWSEQGMQPDRGWSFDVVLED